MSQSLLPSNLRLSGKTRLQSLHISRLLPLNRKAMRQHSRRNSGSSHTSRNRNTRRSRTRSMKRRCLSLIRTVPRLRLSLLSLTLTEGRANQADQLDILLSDHDGQLAIPSKEAEISLELRWDGAQLIDKGTFVVDESEHSGAPDIITIRARAADLGGEIRKRTEKQFPDGIEAHGTDALRFTLAALASTGRDINWDMKRLEGYRNFCNKLWNASRFVLMNTEDQDCGFNGGEMVLSLADRWILTSFNETVAKVTEDLDKFELGDAADAVYNFIWNSYCDWYIELAKKRLYQAESERDKHTVQYVLVYVLTHTLEMLHPFMPFVTEHLWQHLPHSGETLARAPWPAADERLRFPEEQEQMERIMDAIKAVRNMRAEANVAPNRMCHIRIVVHRDDLKKCIETHEEYFEKLGHVEKIVLLAADGTKPENALAAVVTGMEVYLELKGLIDTAKERERIEKAKAALEKEIARTSGKLNNKGFLAKAPEDVVAKEKEKLAEFEEKMKSFDERLRFLADL